MEIPLIGQRRVDTGDAGYNGTLERWRDRWIFLDRILGGVYGSQLIEQRLWLLDRTYAPIDGPIQFLHIDDAHAAFVAAVRRRMGGVFNIVGEGAVTGSQAARMGGRAIVPVWGPMWMLARAVTAALADFVMQQELLPPRRGSS